jgi:orotate phosphoribosyltransferase
MKKVLDLEGFKDVLAAANAVVEDAIFVYKHGTIGTAYVNKEALADLGASVVNSCLRGMAQNAIAQGLELSDFNGRRIGVIGPAYGAISYPPIVAMYLKKITISHCIINWHSE